MLPPILFEKYEGLGNDFLLVSATGPSDVTPEQAVALCDRRFGVGGDGVLLVLPPADPAHAGRMRVLNADGSIAEMCGNGLRCVALQLARAGGVRHETLIVETDAGPRPCAVDDADGKGLVTVDMGVVRVTGEQTIAVAGGAVAVTLADAGNPHAVLFGAFERPEIDRLGPLLARHPAFPRGTNVEFARASAGAIDLVVWERGVGITLACGTGACATVAVACEEGLASRGTPVDVRLPGGTLRVTIDAGGRATMTGPARRVYGGQT